MEIESTVKLVAESLGLLVNGDLKPMNSLTIIDFALDLEDRLKIQIPSALLKVENFQSIASVTALVVRVSSIR